VRQEYKDLLTDAWDTVKDIARPAVRTAKVSWREAFRIFRHSVGPAIWERIVGLAIMCLVATFLVTVFKIWVALARLTK
jgi:hypothetical protein